VRISFQGAFGSFGEINKFSIHGSLGVGAYWLLLSLEPRLIASAVGESGIEIRQLKGLLRLPSGQILSVGHVDGGTKEVWYPYSDRMPLVMFSLTPSQLQELERRRDGGDLALTLWIGGEASNAKTSESFTAQGELLILQQEWLRVLEEMKFQKTMLFEIPIPDDLDEGYAGRFENAHKYLAVGDYKACVGVCRDMLDALRSEKNSASLHKQAKAAKAGDRSLDQRMLVIEDAVREVTHLAHHVSDERFTGEDARKILGMTISLLSATARLI